MKKIILVLTLILLTGCNNAAPETKTADGIGQTPDNSAAETAGGAAKQEDADYSFEYNGITIHMGDLAAPVIEALGEPMNYFEAPSCAFVGIDKIYNYSGFDIFTYPLDGVDYISSVSFSDDSVSTLKGIYLGMTPDKAIAAYGDGYTQELDMYTYTLNDSTLSFLAEDGQIAAITYTYLNPLLD